KIVKEALPVMSEIPEIHIQSIVTTGRNPENVAQLQKQFDIKQVFEDFQAFIEDEKIDTVYLAVPNHLHFDYARKAIAKNKHVICEKPFTLTTEELIILKDLAEQQKVIIIEAITNLYLSNYDVLKQSIPEIGNCKIAQFNYPQYSSRFDDFKNDIIQPAFDPSKGGGALMDINAYNVHLAVGLFGKPNKVTYFPHIEKQIDPSGILVVEHDDIKAVFIGATDPSSDKQSYIHGDKATINLKGPTNELIAFELNYHTGGTEYYQVDAHRHQMDEEFVKIE